MSRTEVNSKKVLVQDNNQKPESRFFGWKDKFFKFVKPTMFTHYGPYGISVFDYEWKPKSDFDFKSAFQFEEGVNGQQIFPSTLFFRVYYPSMCLGSCKSTIDWLPEPSSAYAVGYGNTLNLPRFISLSVFGIVKNSVKQPVCVDSNILCHSCVGKNNCAENTCSCDNSSKFPVAIFSHGIMGNRTTYSSICRELASQGMVVIAIEHRDGSASATYLKDQEKTLLYQNFEKYRSMKNNSPENKDSQMEEFGEERFAFQKRKLDFRLNELANVVEKLTEMNSIPKSDLNTNKSNSNGFIKFGLSGKLNLSELTIIGHSFGGSLALEAIKDKRFYKKESENKSIFKAAVALDPWMFPVDKETPIVDIPLLIIRSEHFQKWDSHYKLELEYFRKSKGTTDSIALTEPGKMYSATILQAGHQQFSDVYLVFPWIAHIKGITFKADPIRVIQVTNLLIMEFLRNHLDHKFPDSNSETFMLEKTDNNNIEDLVFD
ncbi:hypothetical protein BB558_002511 [Smittium angustum]|uniref:1-alkyl-2-acetylglycerophosphocholine esterase n=1 Tax=Smittium angustum TaxID=133377 RepID=A0A2U1J8G9_SMIAN|nr:hypothetical protein BB558_002511 [Smittium angustum]